MPDKRITELTELSDPNSLDLIEVVDVSETNVNLKNKKLTLSAALAVFLPKNNYDATAMPTEDNDETEGYSKGSEWMYDEVLYKLYNPSTGAALWKPILNA
jgi:hypothetical protein